MQGVFEIEGTIYRIDPPQTFTGSTYSKRSFLVEYNKYTSQKTNKTYSDIVKFIAEQDKVATLDFFSVGDNVKVGFSLKGKMWTNKEGEEVNFTEAKAIWFTKVFDQNSAPQAPTAQESANAVVEAMMTQQDISDDDLPF